MSIFSSKTIPVVLAAAAIYAAAGAAFAQGDYPSKPVRVAAMSA